MSLEHDVTKTLDAKGLACPMPVVRTKQTIDGLEPGDVLEVVATDRGSMSDIQGWANGTEGVELLDQEEGEEEGEKVYRHYVRKLES